MVRGASASPPGSSGAFYGREAFNPGRIVGQVLVIVLVLYISDAWLLMFFDYLLGVSLSSKDGRLAVLFGQMFDHRVLSLSTSQGVIAIGSFYISMIGSCSFTFKSLVGRSKRALDFSTTVVLAHLACCALLVGLPASSIWWFVVCSAGVGMVLASEVLSRREEMREIAVPARDVEGGLAEEEDDIRPA